VSIKKTRLRPDPTSLKNDSELLKKLSSPFLVHYDGMISTDSGLWVCSLEMVDKVVDNGLLPLWFIGNLYEVWLSPNRI